MGKKHTYFIGFYLAFPQEGKDAGRVKKEFDRPIKWEDLELIEAEIFEDIKSKFSSIQSVTIFSIFEFKK